MDRNLELARLCLQIRGCYGDTWDIFSTSEIDRFEAFLRPLPGLYIRPNSTNDEGGIIHYQLEVVEAGTFTWIIKKRINAHQDWLDEQNDEGWIFEDNYPNLLLVCENKSTEKRIHRLADSGLFDYEVWTVTRERLATNKKKVWLRYYEEDDMEYVSL